MMEVSPWWSIGAGALLDVRVSAMAVLVALLLDRLWGEPPAWLHPVVGMGRLLRVTGKWIAPSTDKYSIFKPFISGMMVWCVGAALFFVIYAGLSALWNPLHWALQGLLTGLFLKPLLAWRMLRDEVQAVETALSRSLEAGRERLCWLVSRDTTALSAGEVRESALETLAENLSDSVIAPLFWFAVAGLPGAALYRFANTADAMWGYPGWRGQGTARRHWQWAGKWAARADDVLNWLPARITAGLLGGVNRGRAGCLRTLPQLARVTPSPNGGWPMGAMALLLQVRLGKPGVYVLHAEGAVPQAQHLQEGLCMAGRTVMAVAAGAALVLAAAMALKGVA